MPATKSHDAITLLKEDHREAKKMFKEFEEAKGDGRKQKLAHEICLALTVHFELEEQIFYPACEGIVDESELKEGYVEHDAAKLLVAEIEAAEEGTEDDFFDTKVHVLQEEIEHHIEEEEKPGGIFSEARKGKLDTDQPVLVRMHALSPFADVFGEAGARGALLAKSMRMIADEGSGVIVVINRPRTDAFTTAVRLKAGEEVQIDIEELRDYGVGAMILAELGVQDMVLLTNTHHTLIGLDGYGLSIVGERAIGGSED